MPSAAAPAAIDIIIIIIIYTSVIHNKTVLGSKDREGYNPKYEAANTGFNKIIIKLTIFIIS